jgi:hypothetical protein
MSLFDEIRQAAPWAKDLSDRDIVLKGAEITGMQPFEVAKELGVDTSKRGLFGAANDYAIEFGNAVASLPKAALDLVSPGTRASAAIGEFQKEGEARQTLSAQEAKYKLGQTMQSEDLGEQAKGALTYIKENPILSASQAIGSFVGPGAAIKGSQIVSGALNLGSKTSGRVALGSAAGTTGVMAGGDAAGDAYDMVMNSPSLQNMSIEERHGLATDAARKASVVPFALGAGTSFLPGAEKALSMGTKSILRTGAGEFAGEFIEEGTTKLSANLAAQQYAPEVRTMQGVVGSAVMGGVLGGGTGLAVGAMNKQPGSLLQGTVQTENVEGNPSANAINNAIDSNSTEIATNTNQQVTEIQQQQAQLQQAQADAKAQADQVAAQQAQQKAQEQQQAFIDVASTYGFTLNATGTLNLGKALIRTPEIAQQYITQFEIANKDKSPTQKALFGAALASGAVPVKPGATPKAIATSVNTFLNNWQLAGIEDKAEAADWINTVIPTIEGANAVKEAAPLNEFYKALTGQDAPAFATLLEQAAEKPTKTKGVKDGQLQVQGDAGLRAVSEQGGPTQISGNQPGDVRSSSVQPIQPGSLGEGSLSLQTGNLPSSGISTSTGTGGSGVNISNAGPQAQGQVNEGQPKVTIKKRRGGVPEQVVEGSANVEPTIEDKATGIVETVVRNVIDAVVKRKGRMSNVNLQKLKDFIYYDFSQIENKAAKTGELTKKELADMFGVSTDTIDGWQDIANNFFEENRGVIQAQLYQTLDASGISLLELKDQIQASRDFAVGEAVSLEEEQRRSEQVTEVNREDEEDFEQNAVEDAGAADLGLTEVEDESQLDQRDLQGEKSGMGVYTGRTGVSVQEENKPEETINARYIRKAKELEDAENSGDEELTAKLSKELDALVDEAAGVAKKQVAKSEAIAGEKKKGTKNAVQKRSTEGVSVRKQAEVSKGVPSEDTEGGKTATKGKADEKGRSLTVVRTSPSTVSTALAASKKDALAWNLLPVPVKYEQLSPQAKADWAISVKNGKINLADASRVYDENEDNIIDGTDLITEVGEQKQFLMLTNQVNKLNEAQISRLEKHYGEKRNTPDFLQNLKEDVLRYIDIGADAVSGAIRDIIKSISNGVMAMAVVFNPTMVSEPFQFAVPTYETKTVEVVAPVPAEAAQAMSPAAKRAYEVIYPTIKDQLIKNDKLFVVTDKPTATNFIFSPDGKVLFQSKVLIGKTEGNYYKGNNEIVANRVTAAGLYNMGVRTGGKTAADYDFNKVFGIEQIEDGKKYFVTMMHSVYTKESDAGQRLAALKEAGPQNSRYSFGCINVDKETFGKILAGHEKQMDGAKLFIVPDGTENVMEFINGKAVYSSDMVREKAEPLTKTEKVPKQGTGKTEQTLAAKEEKATEETIIKRAQFSRNEGAGKDEIWDQYGLTELLKSMFVANKNFDSLVKIVSTYDELPAYVKTAVKKSGDIQAFVYGKRAYMIADQIEIGQELPVFLHEIGVHLGMEKLLGTANYRKLAGQVVTWASSKNDSIEVKVAKAAKKRVDEAAKVARAEGEPLTADEQLDEMLAYFVEEAVASGINPTAMKNSTSQIAQWFRTLVAALKVGLRKIGFDKFDQLTAGNIVDLAFGAAKMEISGAYHGTSAEFRNFLTSKIGTGEGAVAFGWGLYMAERFGVANQYRKTDVDRKANYNATTATYKGMNRDALQAALLDAENTDDYYEYLAVRNIVDTESFVRGAKSKIDQDHINAYVENLKFNRDNNKIVSWDENGNPTRTLRDVEKANKEIEAASKLKESDFGLPDIVTKGNVMKVLPMVDEESLMDLDEPLYKQPEVLQKIKDGFPQEVLDAIDDKSNLKLEDMTGRDLQVILVDLENYGTTDLFFQMPDSITDSIKQNRFMSEEIVSKYLEYKLGIEGVKYFDASSRSLRNQVTIDKLPLLKKKAAEITSKLAPDARERPAVVQGAAIVTNLARADKSSKQETILKIRTSAGDFNAVKFFTTQEIKDLIENIRDEQERQTKNVVMFKDKGVSRIATFPGGSLANRPRFSLKQAREKANKQLDRLPKPIRTPLQSMMDNIYDFAKKGLPFFSFTEDLADMAAKYVPSAKKYVNLMKERQAIRTKFERNVDLILQKYDSLPAEVKGTGENSVNRFLKDMTMSGKWAYNPGWIKKFDETKDIDPDMKARFEAMPDSAQALIKEVFSHGQSALLAMQKAVNENINTEYDALIAAANAANDTKESAELTKKKASTLTEYNTLMRTNSTKPYAPLKRFGNYVVVGKSQQYIDNEIMASSKTAAPDKIAEARKKLRELEKNEDHYFVQFAETAGEANAIVRDEANNYDYLENFEKDSSQGYGVRDLNDVFNRLRNMVEEGTDSNLSETSQKVLNRLMADLKLTLLSESSARQSERRRKNVAGAEDDMMRAFATQGRATASFIASMENSGNIYDTLRDMKKEADGYDGAGTRAERRRYYNEFMKRHFMGLDYQPSPFIDKALSTTSMWMLLTNPAYYLQNMTQPFMLSLPVMGGKHGYNRSWKEMTRAYADIAGVIRKYGIGEESYAKLPEDVRQVIETLVNRGRIDISLEQDLGRWRSSEDSKFAKFGQASELLRGMAQDIETINRVATAVAAYRLEVKRSNPTNATNYADKIIYTTHGDYSGFNAPRISRSGLGRLATQFRKFQLIQISLMARLFNDAFKNQDAKTRMIGKKALAFTIGHTAVMGGLMGLPGFAAIATLYGMLFGDEDEPDNPELALRRAIGDDTIADLLLKGAPAAAGVDLSGKLGMGQMLSIMPYTDITLSRKGVYEAVGTLITGPFGGLLAKSAEGMGYIARGDYYKGVEQLVPTGLANAMKGFRYGTEGITSKTGDVTMSPDDISTVDAFMVALGLPTKTITDRQFLQSAKFEYDQFYNEKASELKREYVRAYSEGDAAKRGEVMDDWRKLQESRVRNGYTRQPLSTLLRAPQEKTKRERNTVGGVAVNKANRGFVRQTSEL